MKSITFRCEVVTPMFLAGANGKTPELRPPSIKGAMRFWWRAVHGHWPIEDKKDDDGNIIEKGLITQEAEIFGGGGDIAKRSLFSIRVLSDLTQRTNEKPLPHHSGDEKCNYLNLSNSCRGIKTWNKDKCQKGRRQPSISSGVFFIELKGRGLEQNKALFILSCLLGGLGKRSRRGFGSLIISGIKSNSQDCFDAFDMPKTLDEILYFMSLFNTDYQIGHSSASLKIFLTKSSYPERQYPYIEEIQIGNNVYPDYSDLLHKVGTATHDFKNDDPSLGYAKRRDRFASPVFVSALKYGANDYRAIITTLHMAEINDQPVNRQKQEDFKNAIL